MGRYRWSGDVVDVKFGNIAVVTTGADVGWTGAGVGGSGDNIVIIFGDVAVIATGADVGWCRCRLDWNCFNCIQDIVLKYF